jgi:hypothetical protein
MREAILNRLGCSAVDLAHFTTSTEGPDDVNANLLFLNNGQIRSKPIAMHGMELITVQGTMNFTDVSPEPTQKSFSVGFETSQDGVHWDLLPPSQMSEILYVTNIPPNNSQTYIILSKSAYIRLVLTNEMESQYIEGDTASFYYSITEG